MLEMAERQSRLHYLTTRGLMTAVLSDTASPFLRSDVQLTLHHDFAFDYTYIDSNRFDIVTDWQ